VQSVYDHSFLPAASGKRQPQKLERYAQLYARYTNLIQLQGDMMRQDTERMQRAYDQVAAEFAKEQQEQNTTKNKMDDSFVLADLNEYDRRCNTIPKSFEDRVRIAFAASGFIQLLMLFVIGSLNKNDMEQVFARARQLMSSNPNQPIPMFAPAACKLRPDNFATRSITSSDIARWQSRPEELVGKCFVTTEEIMRRTFLVQDYYVKRAGPRYDVVFEDTGLGPEDVNTLDTNALLTIVGNAELIITI